MNQSTNKNCEGCLGEITPDQIVQRTAGLVQGKLLCPTCVDQKRRAAMQTRAPALAAPAPQTQAVANPAPAVQKDEADEVISLIGEDEMPSSKSQMIRSFAEGSTIGGAHHDENLKRRIGAPGDPASRCRTFHGKLTAAGLANMDDVVNEWLDAHPDIFIKNVTSSVGLFEGKSKETHLLLTLFY